LLSEPRATRSSRLTLVSRWRRITTDGRGFTHAVAANREPSSSRRCSRGCAWLNGRAFTSDRDAKNDKKSISSSSESATGGPSTSVPSFNSSHTRSKPLMMMFSIRSSSISGCSRPNRNKALNTARARPSCSGTVQDGRPLVTASAAAASSNSRMIARPNASWVALFVWPRSSPSALVNCSEAWVRNAATNAQSTAPGVG